MVEKKLRKEIDDIVLELMETKEELGQRFGVLKNLAKPAVAALACIIALKIAWRIFRTIVSVLWGHKLTVAALLILGPLGYNKIRSKKQGEPCR
jgi:hypothetical protein